ncbi:MAG: addiction module toxin RelE [Alphaproteobacteria bacterium]|nr:addiction module toxin RelE [Alphaproteobacteria bacterium]
MIYYFQGVAAPVYLLLVYAKSQRDDLTSEQKQRVRALLQELRSHRARK